MSKEKEEKNGCLKLFLYACAALFIMFLITGVMDGIGNLLFSLPWYGNVILTIGALFIITQLAK